MRLLTITQTTYIIPLTDLHQLYGETLPNHLINVLAHQADFRCH